MRISMRFVALGLAGAALAASPAAAQLGLGLGGQPGGGVSVGGNVGAGANVGVNPGAALGTVGNTLDRTVNTLDRTANRALDSELRLATGADLQSGAVVRDQNGHSIGTVQSVSGSTAVVVRNGQMLHVPLAALYHGSSGLMTKLSKTQLRAMANAHASAGANASAHN